MIQVCAWCQQERQGDIREHCSEHSVDQISHGICRDHVLRLRQAYRRSVLRRTALSSPHRSIAAPSSQS